jgi:hypothetical protein
LESISSLLARLKRADAVVSADEKIRSLGSSADRAAAKSEGLHAALQSIGDNAVEQAVKNTDALSKNAAALADSQGRAAAATEKSAAATHEHGTAAAEATPKLDKYQEAEQRLAKAAGDVATVLPTMTVHFGQTAAGAATFADALDEASRQAVELTDKSGNAVSGVDAIALALHELGGKSQQALSDAAIKAANFFAVVDQGSANTAAGLRDRQNAFLAYAKAALDASAGLDEGTKESVRGMLDAKASTLDLTGALKILEDQSSKTGNALLDAAKKAEDAAREERIAREEAGAAAFNAGVQADLAGKAAAAATDKAEKGFTEWGDAASLAALATKGITADTSHANEVMDKLANGIKAARSEFLQTSEAAQKLFDTDFKSFFDLGNSENGSGIDRVFKALADATETVEKHIAADREQLVGMVEDLNNVGAAGSKNFGEFGNDATQASARIGDMVQSIQNGTYEVGILGQQDLAPLLQALEAAKQRTDALRAAAEQASQQLADLNQQLQDERDQQTGNQTDIENRRYEKQVQQIKDLEEKADAAGKAQAEEDLKLAEQIHQKKLKDIADEQAAQQKANQQTNGDGTGASGGSSGAGASSGYGNGSAGGSSRSSGTITVNVTHGDVKVHLPPGGVLANMTDQDWESLGSRLVSQIGSAMTQEVIDRLRWSQTSAHRGF